MNRHGHEQTHGSTSPVAPVAVDATRPPQWNKVNCACACGCSCSRSIGYGEGNIVPVAQDCEHENSSPSASLMLDSADYQSRYASSINSDNEDSPNGDHGVEDHLIQIRARLQDIYRALARQNKCTCHLGILPDLNEYPFGTHASPRQSAFIPSPMLTSTNSMNVELSSCLDDSSTASSQMPGMPSGNSSLFLAYMGGGAAESNTYQQDRVVIMRPLRLTPDPVSSNGETVGGYPTQLADSDFAAFDCW